MTIPRLLVNPCGTVTRREFRTGASVLLVVVMVWLMVTGLNAMDYSFAARMGADSFTSNIWSSLLISNYTPALVPFAFLISWGSFTLSFKRCRTLGLGRGEAALSGVASFLFFASLYSVSNIAQIINIYTQFNGNVVFVWIGLCVLGFINVLTLSLTSGPQDENEVEQKGCGPVRYALLLGRLAAITLGFAAVIGAFLVINPMLVLVIAYGGFWVLIALELVLFVFYVLFTARRMADIGVSLGWLFAALVFLGMILVAKYYVGHASNALLNVVASLAVSAAVAAQFALFMIEPQTTNE